jgi:hypothetical protein
LVFRTATTEPSRAARPAAYPTARRLYVRASESSCPFCGAKLDEVCAGKRAPLGERSTRAALLFAGMATVAGCEAHVVPLYGAPPIRDSGAEESDSGGAVDSEASDASGSGDDAGHE